jgi:hypothetical protein
MGMYTELHYNVELLKATPAPIIAVLKYMLNHDNPKPPLPDHPLFKTERWSVMLRMDSYYFAADTHSTLRLDENGDCYYLCIRCNVKNYGNEIEKFVDWIAPYVEANEGDFLGFSRYEETEDPTLIRKITG